MCCSAVNKCISIVVSVVFGLAVALLFFLGLIPSVLLSIVAALAVAVVLLIVLSILFSQILNSRSSCNGGCLAELGIFTLISILGTIITSIIALSFELSTGATLIASLLLIFLVATFFALMIISIYSLLRCAIRFLS